MMLTGRHFAMMAFTVMCCHEGLAESTASVPMTESQRQGAVFLDALSIPSPGEVFAALNTTSHPNWVTMVMPVAAPVTSDRMQLALAEGVLAANGYIAVQAQDGQQVKNIGREMISVAKALGVSENLMGRGNSLMEFAENNAWDALADELEATENEVKRTMIEQKDHHLVTLTSAAAWLRGVNVAAGIVLADPKLEGAAVMRQPELARHLASQLKSLPDRLKRGALVARVTQTLDEAASLLETMGVTPETMRPALQRLHGETQQVVKEILSSPGAKPSPSFGEAHDSVKTNGSTNKAVSKT